MSLQIWDVGQRWWDGRWAVKEEEESLEVSDGEERREGILIVPTAAAPVISTDETETAKRQLMRRFPDGLNLSAELPPSDWTSSHSQPRKEGRVIIIIVIIITGGSSIGRRSTG